ERPSTSRARHSSGSRAAAQAAGTIAASKRAMRTGSAASRNAGPIDTGQEAGRSRAREESTNHAACITMTMRPDIGERLAVPPVGGAVFFVTFCTIAAFFACVAVYNLMHSDALVTFEVLGSIVWLALVAIWITAALVEAGGLRHLMVSVTGIFAR